MSGADTPGIAVVIGAGGGIGAALHARLVKAGRHAHVVGLARRTDPPLDLADEIGVAAALDHVAALGDLRLVIVATGFLHDARHRPERSVRELDPAHLAKAFAVNAIGPALVLKHALPRLARQGRATVAVLSARVGSIADNRLGGWHAYRASKAALNQLVRTAAVELRRTRPEALLVAMHPGTVDTPLSAPFAKGGLDVRTPDDAAARILSALDRLGPADSGSFVDSTGAAVPW